MTETTLTVNLPFENEKTINVPYTSTTAADEVCIYICKHLGITTLAKHVFALRQTGKTTFLMPNYTFSDSEATSFEFRFRFSISHFGGLEKTDRKAYDYYFHQVRNDVVENKIEGLVYEKHRKELFGLGITDMYRVMLEKGVTREVVQREYKKYIPKMILKKHQYFVKTPIREYLVQLEKNARVKRIDANFVKSQYIKQLNLIAPEYLSETYPAIKELDGTLTKVLVKISPPHCKDPGLKYCFETKKDDWTFLATIEDLGFISARTDGVVEISRLNGIPINLKFFTMPHMWSFISALDGYYRLSCKWIFNLCKDLETVATRTLYAMKCHGPVGGEFSYAKLEAKRSNKCGCFILRESESSYTSYFIDVCVKDSNKPKTFKLERVKEEEFLFHDDPNRYKSIVHLMQAYNDPEGAVYLKECIPPSEYDISPLLLCRRGDRTEAVTDSDALPEFIPKVPVCINYRDLQVYKDRKCLKWDKERKKVMINGNYTKYPKFPSYNFPDNSLSKAKKFCRNPDGDLAGPWCFVENEELGFIEKELCDIPFCYDPECSGFARNASTYMHYTDFNGSALTDIKFGIKLWNSDDFNEASARLALTVLALPLNGQQISDLGVGIEIFISNKESALRYGNKDKPEYEPTPGVLTSTNFTMFTLNWDRGFITFGLEGQAKPIFLAEINLKNNLMGFQKDHFDFYSVQGTNVFWSFPFCLDDGECDVHTTTGGEFQQFWPLRRKDIVFDLAVKVRAFHSAAILITPSPTVDHPYVKLVFLGPNGYTRITLKEYSGASEVVLKELQLENIIDYWEWREFSISFFANSLQIFMKKAIGMHSLLESSNDIFRLMRWFSVSSASSVAHWSFFCEPPLFAQPPTAVLPDCAINTNEPDYIGIQDITSAGLPCLPWSSKKMVPADVATLFRNDTAALAAKNYCRDPELKGDGTFCYALNETGVTKEYCHLRKCKSQQCKMAGTGNDFIGQVAVTRSGRTCDTWDVLPHSVHPEYMYVFNSSYFAEMNSADAKNYCRNPNRDISGSWCYTTDPQTVQDVCNVKDCDRPEESIIIVSTDQNGRKIYILPQWKEEGLHGGLRFALKEWNPDLLSGVVFAIYPKDGAAELGLVIGADMNEKVELYFNGELVESKTCPHLIAAGVWTDFWLQMRKGEVMLGFKGVPTALFEWRSKDMEQAFEPVFIAYHSLFNTMPIGIFFQNNDECHTENTTDNNFLKFLPIGLYSEAENVLHTNLSLKMRGWGQTWISLMWVTNNLNSYQIKIDSVQETVGFYKVEAPPRGTEAKLYTLIEKQTPNVMTTSNWTIFYITWTERQFDIKRNDDVIVHYESHDSPLTFYWFSVAAASGWVTWSANCEPLDLDGPPIDGGWSQWSPWTCTVSCGGGEGFRTRTCSNPHPNIFGKLCDGNPTATGLCNDFPCGDISPTTLEKIHDNLRTKAYSFIIDEGKPLLLMNDRQLQKIVRKESPEAYFEWTLNGVFLANSDRVSFQGDDIMIKSVKSSDAGIYVNMIYRINDHRVILKVITLAVRSATFDVDTRATWAYTLQCHSVILGYVYADLSLKLLLNNKTYVNHGLTTLAAVNVQVFDPLNQSQTGDWQCVVEQKDLKLKWVTNYVRMNVKKKPNFYTHLMEDRLTRPFFGMFKSEEAVLMAVIFIVVAVFLLVAGGVFVYFKFFGIRSGYKRNRRF